MSFWGPIIGAGIGALGGILGGGGKEHRTMEQQQVPQWAPQQLPYLFGGSTWQPETPLMNPYAVNYAGGLSAGYNPAFGPQQPMGFASLLGGMGGVPGTPWFQDPGATPQPGGLAALLGIGAGGPPPLLMDAPQFGFGVANPDLLHQQPGSGLTPGPEQQAPQQPGGPAPAPTAPPPVSRGYQDLFFAGSSPRYGPWWDQGRGQGTREYVDALRRRGQIQNRERALRDLQGRNVRDLSPEELALLGL